ncbi:hypothetical protein B0H15DRAFT_1001402, partial [Mycena belliarum]
LSLYSHASFPPRPEYLPLRWSAQVHPEGQLYFYCDGPLRVVTEAYLYHPKTLENVCIWIDHIQDLLSGAKTAISGDIELFIKLEGEDCAYYFVDHSTRTQFWLENSNTEELDLLPVISMSQLRILLEELYWIHVEHFPMHLASLPDQALEEIIGIFSHGLCDQMTSRVSTFLYTAKDCEAFIGILQGCRGTQHSTTALEHHRQAISSRPSDLLTSSQDHNRYITHYGQEHARLSRDQSILYDPTQKHRWISAVMAALTFTTSNTHLARLDDVFVDSIVYSDRWKCLVTDSLRQWKAAEYGTLSGLLLHLPFLLLPSQSPILLTISVTLFGSALASSIILSHKYEPMQGLSATDAMYYLDAIQSSAFKFQPLALAFSLPKALQLWGFLVLLANYVLVVGTRFGFGAGLAVTGVALYSVLLICCTISEAFHNSLEKVGAGFRSTNEDSEAVSMV